AAPDPRPRGLARPALGRERRRRAAEQRDELAPFHSITSSASARRVGGISMPIAFAVLTLIKNLYCCNGQDCRPVQAMVLPNSSYYLPRTNEIIPADKATPSPDDRFHQCTYFVVNYDFEPGSPE